jgi:hypothetical protein
MAVIEVQATDITTRKKETIIICDLIFIAPLHPRVVYVPNVAATKEVFYFFYGKYNKSEISGFSR